MIVSKQWPWEISMAGPDIPLESRQSFVDWSGIQDPDAFQHPIWSKSQLGQDSERGQGYRRTCQLVRVSHAWSKSRLSAFGAGADVVMFSELSKGGGSGDCKLQDAV